MNRKSHWNGAYEGKAEGEVSWFQSKPERSLELIDRSGIPHSGTLIDVGGGASLLVDYLVRDGFKNITVLDISSVALRTAQTRLGEPVKSIDWVEADITQFQTTKHFDLWHDRAVFHFLTQTSERKRYINLLHQTIKPGGHVIIAAFTMGGPKKCSGLDIVQYDAIKLSQELGEVFTLIEQEDELHITPSGNEQAFGYYHFKRQASLDG